MQLVMFTKHLQEFPVAEAAKRVKALGFDGLDLTVRPGGHVVPERVGVELPKAVAAARAEGLGVPMISTAITGATTPHAEAILAAAAHDDRRSTRRVPSWTGSRSWPRPTTSRSASTTIAGPATSTASPP